MAIDVNNRVIHRFIQNISEYELGGKFYAQIIPLDTQAYAIYSDENGSYLNYVIGDGEHTYTELRDGRGKLDVYKEYPVLTKNGIHLVSDELQKLARDISKETEDRQAFDILLDESLGKEIQDRQDAIQHLSDELNNKINNHTNDKNNPHQVTKEQIGLGNVDNTKDIDKPISIATQAALDQKQNNLTQAQLDAVNSGITSSGVNQINLNKTGIVSINEKIPEQASSDNKLADRNFVNSSISTNTATFIGTFESLEALQQYTGPLTNNDYAFVISTDSIGNSVYNRYKYTTATNPASWEFEYSLNNSSFTSNQWAAINSGATSENISQIDTNTSAISAINNSSPMTSGITSGKVSSYDNHISDSNIHVTTVEKQLWSSKQDALTAGNNIQINGSTISATDTTYTAGTGIRIENGVISSTQTSGEWGSITGNIDNQIDLKTKLEGKVSSVSSASVVYGTDSQGDPTTYAVNSFGAVDDVRINGTSVVVNKIAALTVDADPTENSLNLVTSGGVYNAIPSIIIRDWSNNNNV